MGLRNVAFGLVTLLLGACGEGGGPSGQAPAPGVSADGWKSAFSDKGARCADDEAAFASLAKVTVGSTSLYVGYEQVSANNQDPIVARFDGGQKVYCRRHEDDPPDGRAVGVTWDGGDFAYVVYTIVGGGSDLEGKGGWLGSYAPGAISGGGPKVSYLGRVDVRDGTLDTGTFIIAVKSDNKVNAHTPRAAPTVLQDGSVEFLGGSAHKPIDTDGKSAMSCTDYPFESRYRFSADLRSLVCADCTNCTSKKPCATQ